MRIVFMGTPEFAIPSLKLLLESKHEIAAVVSAPDKERGRGKQISATPVKTFAVENNLNVLTPASLEDEMFINQLKEFNADLFIIVAFKILPVKVFTIPKYGSFNLHGSLLPKYRGAAPMQWALINGETETGVTTFFLEEKVDTGNVILQEKISIEPTDDLGSLHDKMMMMGADAVLKTVDLIESGNITLSKQNNAEASPAPKITKDLCKINWSKSSNEIHNLVRGLSPTPGAFFETGQKKIKVLKTKIFDANAGYTGGQFKPDLIPNENRNYDAGTIFESKKEILVKTGDGFLNLTEIQAEGRKRMSAEEFLRGQSLLS